MIPMVNNVGQNTSEVPELCDRRPIHLQDSWATVGLYCVYLA